MIYWSRYTKGVNHGGKLGGDEDEASLISTSTICDLILVVLIIFMVTATYITKINQRLTGCCYG